MEHISPSDRYQVAFGSLDELIAPNDPVRFLDAFAEKMDLIKLFSAQPHSIRRAAFISSPAVS